MLDTERRRFSSPRSLKQEPVPSPAQASIPEKNRVSHNRQPQRPRSFDVDLGELSNLSEVPIWSLGIADKLDRNDWVASSFGVGMIQSGP